MERRSGQDKTILKIDLLITLRGRDAVQSDPVTIDTALSWFGADDQEVAQDILEELDDNPDAPFEYESSDEEVIYLTAREETSEFIERLEEDPPWYDRI